MQKRWKGGHRVECAGVSNRARSGFIVWKQRCADCGKWIIRGDIPKANPCPQTIECGTPPDPYPESIQLLDRAEICLKMDRRDLFFGSSPKFVLASRHRHSKDSCERSLVSLCFWAFSWNHIGLILYIPMFYIHVQSFHRYSASHVVETIGLALGAVFHGCTCSQKGENASDVRQCRVETVHQKSRPLNKRQRVWKNRSLLHRGASFESVLPDLLVIYEPRVQQDRVLTNPQHSFHMEITARAN